MKFWIIILAVIAQTQGLQTVQAGLFSHSEKPKNSDAAGSLKIEPPTPIDYLAIKNQFDVEVQNLQSKVATDTPQNATAAARSVFINLQSRLGLDPKQLRFIPTDNVYQDYCGYSPDNNFLVMHKDTTIQVLGKLSQVVREYEGGYFIDALLLMKKAGLIYLKSLTQQMLDQEKNEKFPIMKSDLTYIKKMIARIYQTPITFLDSKCLSVPFSTFDTAMIEERALFEANLDILNWVKSVPKLNLTDENEFQSLLKNKREEWMRQFSNGMEPTLIKYIKQKAIEGLSPTFKTEFDAIEKARQAHNSTDTRNLLLGLLTTIESIAGIDSKVPAFITDDHACEYVQGGDHALSNDVSLYARLRFSQEAADRSPPGHLVQLLNAYKQARLMLLETYVNAQERNSAGASENEFLENEVLGAMVIPVLFLHSNGTAPRVMFDFELFDELRSFEFNRELRHWALTAGIGFANEDALDQALQKHISELRLKINR